MRDIVDGSVQKVLGYVADPAHADEIKRGSFEAALHGIRTGVMTYQGDQILPMI